MGGAILALPCRQRPPSMQHSVKFRWARPVPQYLGARITLSLCEPYHRRSNLGDLIGSSPAPASGAIPMPWR